MASLSSMGFNMSCVKALRSSYYVRSQINCDKIGRLVLFAAPALLQRGPRPRIYFLRSAKSHTTPSISGGNFVTLHDAVISVSTGPFSFPIRSCQKVTRVLQFFAHHGVSYRAFARVVAIIYTFACSPRDREQIADRPGQDECERSFCVGRTEWQSRF
jgi:hypothetical protein